MPTSSNSCHPWLPNKFAHLQGPLLQVLRHLWLHHLATILRWLIHDVPHLPLQNNYPSLARNYMLATTMTKSRHWFSHLVSRINQTSSDPSLGQSMFSKGLFFHQTKNTQIITDSFPMHWITGSLHFSTKIRDFCYPLPLHFASFPFRMTGPSWDAPHHTGHGLNHCETSGHVSWREWD